MDEQKERKEIAREHTMTRNSSGLNQTGQIYKPWRIVMRRAEDFQTVDPKGSNTILLRTFNSPSFTNQDGSLRGLEWRVTEYVD